jgi:hypothetical protein
MKMKYFYWANIFFTIVAFLAAILYSWTDINNGITSVAIGNIIFATQLEKKWLYWFNSFAVLVAVIWAIFAGLAVVHTCVCAVAIINIILVTFISSKK